MLKAKGIRTSYFARYKGAKGVAITLFPPKWYTGECYDKLAPPKFLLLAYKNGDIGEAEFEALYKYNVLRTLDPKVVYEELRGKVLLCFETSDKFCHRHLVAKWLEESLNITIREI